MKNIFLILVAFLAFNFISCTKSKTPVSFISLECPDTIKFNTQILPIMSDYCFSCHNTGTSPQISDYSSVSANADKILKSFTGNGIQFMPQGGSQIHDSLIQQFSCWISQGKINN